jgi:UDP-glucose 4-epimerase
MLGTDQTLGAVALRGRRVLVTGARGFLGGALCRALSAGGAELYASSREHPLIDGDGGARWRRSDPADAAAAITLIRDVAPEVIFHMSAAVNGSRNLAAVLPTFRDGLSSTVNLLTAAAEAGVDRFVLAGSVEARAQDGVPRSPYAASKAAATTYATMFGALFGLRCVDVRISMTYGPGQGDLKKLVPYVIEEARFGRSPSLGSGTRLADWIYVDDTVAALLAAADSPMAIGQSIELGTGILTSVREVVERLVKLVNPAVQPRFGAVANRPYEDEAPVDPNPAQRLLNGWAARVELSEGLRRTVTAALNAAKAEDST